MSTLGKHWKLSEKTKKKLKERKKMSNEGKVKLREANIGKKNPNWKGKEVGYVGVHKWVAKILGKAKECSDCGKIGEKVGRRWNIDWSNCDHKYRRNTKDYTGRCAECHRNYDLKSNLRR